MEKDIKNKNTKIVKRSYLARDFNSFKLNLINHAKTFFPDNIDDFSEAGLGGMFVDMISYIGDSMSFYLDHQFNELKWSEAIEIDNIKKHIELAGVDIYGASPSTVYVNCYIRLPWTMTNGTKNYKVTAMPTIKKGTRFQANNGTTFNLMEDLNFSTRTRDGKKYLFENNTIVPSRDDTKTDIVFLPGMCVSGEIKEDTYSIGDDFTPFREIVLTDENISLIESVKDSDGNVYYEVDNLSQDNVFTIFDNKDLSNNSIEKVISLVPAPYRYTRSMDPQSFNTTLTFGGGDAQSNDDDLLPDPADLSLPLYGKTTFSRFSLDPNSLLRTQTLGVAPRNTTITVKYRHGGGFSHNVAEKTIREIIFLDMTFPSNVEHNDAITVRTSLDIMNLKKASGGSAPPTITELRDQIPVARNSQNRVVTKEDLLARIYSLPAPLGRVFRAAMAETPNSNGQIEIALISRNFDGTLINYGSMQTTSNELQVVEDNLKINLKNYLEQFRMINDSYIIMDAAIHNFGLRINVIGQPGIQKTKVVQSILTNLKNILVVDKFHINQPISLGDISYAVLSSEGVSSLDDSGIRRAITVESCVGIKYDGTDMYNYSLSSAFNSEIIERGFIFPKKNGIFELKYPDFDIRVSVR